jgi:ATP-dependent RNA helicase RhlE
MERPDKAKALLDMISKEDFSCGLVFTKTKHGADKVTKALNAAGANAHAIHGNRSQAQREKALNAFRSGKAKILVATDIAARGIDVSGISHVINYDLPNVPETYVHRIGRTARAGAAGTAISFCAGDERPFLRSIERLTQRRISVVTNDAGVLTPVYRPDAGAPFGGDELLKEEGEPGRGRRSGGGPGQAKRKQHRKGQNRGPQQGEKFGAKPGQPFRKKFKSRSDVSSGEQHKADHTGVKSKAAANGNSPARTQKGQEHGERGTAGIRRRRNRGPAGRELSRHAG